MSEKPVLAWSHEITSIPERGLEVSRSASPLECEAIAKAVDLIRVGSLLATYRVRAIGKGGYAVQGTVTAEVEQRCVVSLEPVPERIDETFDVEFRRVVPTTGDADPETEQPVLESADIEPIEQDRIEVGRIVYETLAAGLDPYPRKEGTAFEWQDPKAKDAQTHPFAVLGKLKSSE